MVRFKSVIIFVVLAVLFSGCTGGQDVTPIVKTLPEVQQFLKEHPNAKITVTYWSKEDVGKIADEISQQCDKPITPAAMYKAVISDGELKSIAWIDASTQTLICSTTEGKGGTTTTPTPAATSTPLPTSTPIPAQTSAPTPTITPTPTPFSTPPPESFELKQGYALYLARVEGVTETRNADGTMTYSKSDNKARIWLQLLREGKVVNEQVVTEGTAINLYDDGKLVVKANFRTLFLGATGYMVRFDNLIQYDKETGETLFTQNIVTLTISYLSVPTVTSTPVLTSTPTPTFTPTPVATSTPPPTPAPTPTSTYTVPDRPLTEGETWSIGDLAGTDFSRGYELSIISIDASTTPKQVRLAFSKNGNKLDESIVTEGGTYIYSDIFSTKIASIYRSGAVDVVRLENSSIAI